MYIIDIGEGLVGTTDSKIKVTSPMSRRRSHFSIRQEAHLVLTVSSFLVISIDFQSRVCSPRPQVL